MQQAGGKGITSAGGVHQLPWVEGWLNAGLILQAPTHRGRAISDDDVGPLGQGSTNRSGIVDVEKPKRFPALPRLMRVFITLASIFRAASTLD